MISSLCGRWHINKIYQWSLLIFPRLHTALYPSSGVHRGPEFSSVSVGLSSGPGSGPHTPLSRLTSIHISGGISRWSQASWGISNIPHVLRLSRTLVLVEHSSVHVGGGSSRPNEALHGFGVPPLPCCPEKCPAVRSDLFRVSSPYKWFHFIQTIWLQLNSGHVRLSLVYQLCVRAVRRTQQLVGGHSTLGEHFDPATEREIALWSGGDEMGRGHAELCLCNWGLTDPLQGAACEQSIEEYRIPLPHVRGAKRWSRPKWSQISCFAHLWH